MSDKELESNISVQFKIGDSLILKGNLRHVLAPRTIDRILQKLPITSRIHLWKDEIYFEIGVKMGAEKAVPRCNAGDLAYWPQGDAFCIFFKDMTPYSPVNPVGQLTTANFEAEFAKIKSGLGIQMNRI